jgi:hypothetical protein
MRGYPITVEIFPVAATSRRGSERTSPLERHARTIIRGLLAEPTERRFSSQSRPNGSLS